MKYYVVEIANGDKKISGKGVYEYDSMHDAIASFHQKLGTAMKSELYVDDLVMVIDEVGAVYKLEKVSGKYVEAAEEVTEEAAEE